MKALSLDALGEDVLYLVALAVFSSPGMLKMLPPRITISGRREAPPATIRALVRELTYSSRAPEYEGFGWELDFFPYLVSIRFAAQPGYCPVPWRAIKTCIAHPKISSICFLHCLPVVDIDGVSEEEIPSTSLTDLSCIPYVWRDVLYFFDRGDVSSEHVSEAESLMLLVPPMSRLARHLDLPLETAPLRQMAAHSWPVLRELHLSGRYLSPDQMGYLSAMLVNLPDRLPSLLHLSILASPPAGSLALSYPDPDDAICSIQAPNLIHLSLRDWPRYYYPLYFPDALTSHMGCPIISSTECLLILKRMSASTRLERLELVYEADDAENDLLCHITSAYPHIWSVELHRYRKESNVAVPYEQIAQRLATMKWLQRVRLNLDFPETTGPSCDSGEAIDRWTARFLPVGRQIMAILHAACPMLVALEMLKQNDTRPVWTKFYPVREPSLYSVDLECLSPNFLRLLIVLHSDGEWPPFIPPMV